MAESPAFQWYPRDILSSARVQEMSLVEECVYRRLIDYCWLNGSIPKDPKRALKLVGKRTRCETLTAPLKMFVCDPNDDTRLIHERLEVERAKQSATRNKRRKAAEARWNKQSSDTSKSNAHADAHALQMECSSSSSSTAVVDTKVSTLDTSKPSAKKTTSRMKRPSIEEWLEYASSIGFAKDDAQSAFDYYVSNGWKVGKNPMKDWKASCRTCSRRSFSSPAKKTSQGRAPVKSAFSDLF